MKSFCSAFHLPLPSKHFIKIVFNSSGSHLHTHIQCVQCTLIKVVRVKREGLFCTRGLSFIWDKIINHRDHLTSCGRRDGVFHSMLRFLCIIVNNFWPQYLKLKANRKVFDRQSTTHSFTYQELRKPWRGSAILVPSLLPRRVNEHNKPKFSRLGRAWLTFLLFRKVTHDLRSRNVYFAPGK